MSYWLEDADGKYLGDLATNVGINQLRLLGHEYLNRMLDTGTADAELVKLIVVESVKDTRTEYISKLLANAVFPVYVTDGCGRTDEVENVFCSTGKGGGVDPSCSKGGEEVVVKSDRTLVEEYTRTSGTYSKVNEGLREGKDMSADPTVVALDHVFDKQSEPSPAVLYRGIAGWEPEELNLVEGRVFTDLGFVSTSEKKVDAAKFAMAGKQEMSGEAVGILIKINTGKVASLNMGRFSMYDEKELLLRRGTQFKITSVKEGYPGEKLAVVTMSVVKS